MRHTKLAIAVMVAIVLTSILIIGALNHNKNPEDNHPKPSPTDSPSPSPTQTPIPPTLSPTPTPTPTPDIAGDFVGICVHSLSSEDAQLVAESGATWVRIDVSPDFSNAVANAKAHNLRVLGILGSWMFDKSTVFTLEQWRDAVTNYVSNNPTVDAWEIWNEPSNPNINNTLLQLAVVKSDGTTIQENITKLAQFYFNMTEIAHQVIRQQSNPSTIVLMGGLNLFSGGDPNLALDQNFASELKNMDITQFSNVISVHAYSWSGINKPEDTLNDSYTQSLNYYHTLFPNAVFWVTETGQQFDSNNQSIQSQYLTRSLQFFNGKVSNVFWYSLHDNLDEINQTSPQLFGLANADGTLRPSYAAIKNLINP